MAVESYKASGLVGATQKDLWRQGIERLCSGDYSQTKLASVTSYTLKDIIECASWIAIISAFSQRSAIWNDEEARSASLDLRISDLQDERFSPELIRETLRRGIFSPLGDGRIRFSHALYAGYLAAQGLMAFIPEEQWPTLLMNGLRNAVFSQFSEIASWLACFNEKFKKRLFEIQPELILASSDSVQSIGPLQLSKALIERSDKLSHRMRTSHALTSNLHRLNHPGLGELIGNTLLGENCTEEIREFAFDIIGACKLRELTPLLIDHVLDRRLPLRRRIDAAYTLKGLGHDPAVSRLKNLLPIEPAEDPHDDLFGAVLRCCWPDHLSPEELISYLRRPQHPDYGGAYSIFIGYEFPETFSRTLSVSNAPVFLKWSLEHLNEHDIYDRLGKTARVIYAYCWRWAEEKSINAHLATGYLVALKQYRHPFPEEGRDRFGSDDRPFLSREDFLFDVKKRFALIEDIIDRPQLDERIISHSQIGEYPLITESDFGLLLDWVLKEPCDQLLRRLAILIKAIINRVNIIDYSEKIQRFHKLRPDLMGSYEEIVQQIESLKQQSVPWEEDVRKLKEQREIESQRKQNHIDFEIKRMLHDGVDAWKNIEKILVLVNCDNGAYYAGPSPVDISKSPGWDKLSEEERLLLVDFAEQYLHYGEIEPTEPRSLSYTVSAAFTLVRLFKPKVYESLDKAVWERCGVELLKSAVDRDLELIYPLFDRFAEKFPDSAEKALLEVLNQHLTWDCVSILSRWGKRFTKKTMNAVLKKTSDPALKPGLRSGILEELIALGFGDDVRVMLDSIFISKLAVSPNSEHHQLFLLAFYLNPAGYAESILRLLASDTVWGRRWIEQVVLDYTFSILTPILSCPAHVIAEFYCWFDHEYPPETRPMHKGAYSPGSLDRIHEIMDRIINHLSKSGKPGSAAALTRIKERSPVAAWLEDCIIDARSAELSESAPEFTVSELRSLRDPSNSSRRLIHSIEDLHDLVLNSLKDYQGYLQGDTPAIGDLWNTPPQVKPKDEEASSDHITRYLRQRVPQVVINREVEIRAKQFSGGQSGSKTDIWIEVPLEGRRLLTLCIEVKCNWNREAKTALRNQLIDKYMSGETATAGILLLVWFECDKWDGSDNRLNKITSIWKDRNSAEEDLERQVERERANGNLVSAIVIDCGLR